MFLFWSVVKHFNQFSIRVTWSVRARVGNRPSPKNNTESNLNYGSKRLGIHNPLNKQGGKSEHEKKKKSLGGGLNSLLRTPFDNKSV